jgi:ABC-type molybdenum transport system ATPase subunit/photorepair protein PhrA
MRIVTVTVAAFLVINYTAVAAFTPTITSQRRVSLFASAATDVVVSTEEPTGTTVGDTKGAVLRLTEVAISRGDTAILKNIEWSVQANERWGIVGTV